MRAGRVDERHERVFRTRPRLLVEGPAEGIEDVVASIAAFRAHSQATQAARRKSRSEYRLRELVSQRFMDHLEREVLGTGELGAIVDRIAARDIDPYTAANDLLGRAIGR